jgi:single-stranded DNA-binding protein
VAVSGRRDSEASFFTVIVWRDQAQHAAQSLSKGSRVVVVGRLQQRAWIAEDSSTRQAVEVVARSWARACDGDRHTGQGHQERRGVAITGHVNQDDTARGTLVRMERHAGVRLRLPVLLRWL